MEADFSISASDPKLIDQVLGFTCDVDAGMQTSDLSFIKFDTLAVGTEPAPLWQKDGTCTLVASVKNIRKWIQQHNLGVLYGQEVLVTRVMEMFCKMGFELKTANSMGDGINGSFCFNREYIFVG